MEGREMKLRVWILCLAIVAIPPLLAQKGRVAAPAQAAPNFTGEWTMNAAQSDFGQFPSPGSFIYRIEHEGNNIKIVTTGQTPMGETTVEVNCVIGGAECTVKSPFGNTKSTAKWDGDILVADFTTAINGMQSKRTERMSLSADGKVMTIRSQLGGATGEMRFTVVLDKK